MILLENFEDSCMTNDGQTSQCTMRTNNVLSGNNLMIPARCNQRKLEDCESTYDCELNDEFYCQKKTFLNNLSEGQVGTSGERGDEGLPGETGDKGQDGLQGFKGEKGELGSGGERGMSGGKGLEGEFGSMGKPGFKGFKGRTGSNDNIYEYEVVSSINEQENIKNAEKLEKMLDSENYEEEENIEGFVDFNDKNKAILNTLLRSLLFGCVFYILSHDDTQKCIINILGKNSINISIWIKTFIYFIVYYILNLII